MLPSHHCFRILPSWPWAHLGHLSTPHHSERPELGTMLRADLSVASRPLCSPALGEDTQRVTGHIHNAAASKQGLGKQDGVFPETRFLPGSLPLSGHRKPHIASKA